MRDRTRPMKWVERLATENQSIDAIKTALGARVKNPGTVNDQLRALRKHGLLPQESIAQDVVIQERSVDGATDDIVHEPQPKIKATVSVKRKR